MLEFSVSIREFTRAIRLLLAGRQQHADYDTADLTARADSVELRSTGTSVEIPATVVQGGSGRIPTTILPKLKRAAASFKTEHLRVTVETGRVRIGSFSTSHSDIELRPVGSRTVDLPIDATALDCLAVQALFSADEIAASGLAARVLDAQETAIEAIKGATMCLSEFSVPREAVRELVEAHVALYARATLAAISKDCEED